MKLDKIRIEIFASACPPLDHIKDIFKQCSWWSLSDENFESLYQNTWKTFLVFNENNKPVAHSRILSDKHVYGLFVDFMVAPDFRKQGIGELLANKMLEVCKEQKLKMLKLMATKEGKGLYEKIGFKPRPNKGPGMMAFLKYDE